jgi:hypothetical protein
MGVPFFLEWKSSQGNTIMRFINWLWPNSFRGGNRARKVGKHPALAAPYRQKSDSAPAPENLSEWIDWDMTTEQGNKTRMFVPLLLPVDCVEFLIWLLPQVIIQSMANDEQFKKTEKARHDQADAYARIVEAYNAIGSLAAASTRPNAQGPQGTSGTPGPGADA